MLLSLVVLPNSSFQQLQVFNTLPFLALHSNITYLYTKSRTAASPEPAFHQVVASCNSYHTNQSACILLHLPIDLTEHQQNTNPYSRQPKHTRISFATRLLETGAPIGFLEGSFTATPARLSTCIALGSSSTASSSSRWPDSELSESESLPALSLMLPCERSSPLVASMAVASESNPHRIAFLGKS